LHYNDNLVYHYTGGIALAALKRWPEAEEFFEICVSSPGQSPAAIQMEALKKLVLVQLISRGNVRPNVLFFGFRDSVINVATTDDESAQVHPSEPVTAVQDHAVSRFRQLVPAPDGAPPDVGGEGEERLRFGTWPFTRSLF
jgi:hypothetical protein